MIAELAAARRILAVRLDNIGDVVLTGPALRALARALPGADITLLASRAGAQVAPMLPWIRDTIVCRPLWQDVSSSVPFDPTREIAFATALGRRRFDAAFVFTSFNQSPDVPGYVAYLAGIPTRVGHARLFSGGVFSHPVAPPPDETHAADRNLSLLDGVGIPPGSRALELHVPRPSRVRAASALAGQGLDATEPFVAVAPGASAVSRRYPAERYAQVAALLAARTRLPIVVVGHQREVDLAAAVISAARRANPAARIVSMAGRTDLLELAALVERASLLITNDSGPMHLADAFGTPQVVLFSGSDLESQWRPRRSPLALLRRRTACSPCYRFDCPYDLACLDIPPDEVVDEAVALLSPASSERRAPAVIAATPPTEPDSTTPAATA